VTKKNQRSLRVWIATAATAILCWLYVPTSSIDRHAFLFFAQLNHGHDVNVSGDGSHRSPWQLRWNPDDSDSNNTPVSITLNDDPDGFFQSSPHAPVDIAVILNNMQRLGARRVAYAPLLAWANPDPIGLTALETQMNAFESIAIAVPLTRGAVMEPMPAAFRRASLPIEDIKGNIKALPVINRASIPNMIYGTDNTLAGFQVLDSEPDNEAMPLLARWDYRVVFAFPLLAAMQQLQLKPEDLTIQVGESIKLGDKGPTIAIDEFGRLVKKAEHKTNLLEIPAEALIDGKKDLLKNHSFTASIISDHRSINESAIAEFNRILAPSILFLTTGNSSQTRAYHRLSSSQEIYTLLTLTLFVALATPIPGIYRLLVYIAITCTCVLIHYTIASYTHYWLPGIPALAGIAIAMVASSFGRKKGATAYLPIDDGLNYVRYSGQ